MWHGSTASPRTFSVGAAEAERKKKRLGSREVLRYTGRQRISVHGVQLMDRVKDLLHGALVPKADVSYRGSKDASLRRGDEYSAR